MSKLTQKAVRNMAGDSGFPLEYSHGEMHIDNRLYDFADRIMLSMISTLMADMSENYPKCKDHHQELMLELCFDVLKAKGREINRPKTSSVGNLFK